MRTRSTSTQHRPKIDAYGTVRLLGNEYKGRIMEYAPGQLAIFRVEDPTTPTTLELTSDLEIRGRIMRTTFTAEGEEAELFFQKAGCGCETPRTLRAGRTPLLNAAGLNPEQATE